MEQINYTMRVAIVRHIVFDGTILLLLLCAGGCKKDPVGPPPPKNPREYTWTVDTLAYPGSLQTLMRHAWGSSSSNIYICGHNDTRYGNMYHWNGQSWTNVRLHVSEGGSLTSIGYFRGISGLSSESVYAAGIGQDFVAFLIHFNGSQWREINVPGGRGLQSIWVRSSTEIWLGGLDGYLARYNGSQFARDSVPYTFDSTGHNIQVSQIVGDNSGIHLVLGVSPDTLFNPIFYFYERIGSQWETRDSSYDFARMFLSPSGKLYRYGVGGVQQRMGDSWMPILSELATVGMGADADNNMYAVGYYGVPSAGRIYHHNGSDWFEFNQLRMDEVTFNSVWTDGREAFVIGTTSGSPMKTVVLHGK
jgi:hypothetical protein